MKAGTLPKNRVPAAQRSLQGFKDVSVCLSHFVPPSFFILVMDGGYAISFR